MQKDNVKTLSTTEPGKQTIEVGGNKITIDGSTSGAEKIEVTVGKSTITLDAPQGTFSVTDGNNNKIESSSSGLTIASAMNSEIALGTTVDIKSAVGSLADKLAVSALKIVCPKCHSKSAFCFKICCSFSLQPPSGPTKKAGV